MGNCKTCKHWNQMLNVQQVVSNAGICQRTILAKLIRADENDFFSVENIVKANNPAENISTSASAILDGCMPATMFTGPDFGCVNHEEKQ